MVEHGSGNVTEALRPDEVSGTQSWRVHRDNIQAALDRGTINRYGETVEIWPNRRERMKEEIKRLNKVIKKGKSNNHDTNSQHTVPVRSR